MKSHRRAVILVLCFLGVLAVVLSIPRGSEVGSGLLMGTTQGTDASVANDSARQVESGGQTYMYLLRGSMALVFVLGIASGIRASEGNIRRFQSVGRLVLGVVLVVSSATKMVNLGESTRALAYQWHMPREFVLIGLVGVLAAEVCVVGCIFLGRSWVVRLAPPALLYGGFLGYTFVAEYLGKSGDCGCFCWEEPLGLTSIFRNIGFVLILAGLYVAWRMQAVGRMSRERPGDVVVSIGKA